jgi:hypothetical protein
VNHRGRTIQLAYHKAAAFSDGVLEGQWNAIKRLVVHVLILAAAEEANRSARPSRRTHLSAAPLSLVTISQMTFVAPSGSAQALLWLPVPAWASIIFALSATPNLLMISESERASLRALLRAGTT